MHDPDSSAPQSDPHLPADEPDGEKQTARAPFASRDVLHGVTLEAMLHQLVECYGWPGLAERVPVRCFMFDPSITSSLRFLRKTPWARTKVERLFRELQSGN